MKQRVHNEELTAVLLAAGLLTEEATPTQILLLLLGQLETLRLQTLDHGFPQLGVLPRSDSKNMGRQFERFPTSVGSIPQLRPKTAPSKIALAHVVVYYNM